MPFEAIGPAVHIFDIVGQASILIPEKIINAALKRHLVPGHMVIVGNEHGPRIPDQEYDGKSAGQGRLEAQMSGRDQGERGLLRPADKGRYAAHRIQVEIGSEGEHALGRNGRICTRREEILRQDKPEPGPARLRVGGEERSRSAGNKTQAASRSDAARQNEGRMSQRGNVGRVHQHRLAWQKAGCETFPDDGQCV